MNREIVPIVLILVFVLASTSFSGCIEDSRTPLKVFHAGSLSVPLSTIESEFEGANSNVDVRREASGSVDAVKKITDLGKKADVLASADYSLIETMMMPEYASWGILFARNEMVLAYTDESQGHNGINSTNWQDILRQSGVKIGFSDPNSDPCGYRALMVIKLHELYISHDNLFQDLIVNNSAFTQTKVNNSWELNAPSDQKPANNIVIRPKETDLVALLEVHTIDYLFIYKSIAVQHADSGMKYIELDQRENLGNHSMDDSYGVVSVVKNYGTEGAKLVKGRSIVYGLTIPKCSEHPDLALKFVEFILSDKGRAVFQNCGQDPIYPAQVIGKDNLPDELRRYTA